MSPQAFIHLSNKQTLISKFQQDKTILDISHMFRSIKNTYSSLSNCSAVNHLSPEHMICHWKQITIARHNVSNPSSQAVSLKLPPVARRNSKRLTHSKRLSKLQQLNIWTQPDIQFWGPTKYHYKSLNGDRNEVINISLLRKAIL